MRTLKWMTLFMAVATMSVFTGCDKDEDKKDDSENGKDPVVTEITGTYSGKVTVSALGAPMGENDAIASLEKTDSTYSLVLNDLIVNPPFEGSEMEIGDVTFENVIITNGKFVGEYEISVTVNLPPALSQMVGGMETMELPVSLVSGTVAENNMQFTLSVTVPKVMPNPETGEGQDLVVSVDFNGNK